MKRNNTYGNIKNVKLFFLFFFFFFCFLNNFYIEFLNIYAYVRVWFRLAASCRLLNVLIHVANTHSLQIDMKQDLLLAVLDVFFPFFIQLFYVYSMRRCSYILSPRFAFGCFNSISFVPFTQHNFQQSLIFHIFFFVFSWTHESAGNHVHKFNVIFILFHFYVIL